ncbi:MAG: hypothetical protein M1120_03420 [Patescibacteria group bacterium]|nr:hypothetical protein [Patescibacteria group bacterium]
MRKTGVSLFLLLTVFVLAGCGPSKQASVTPTPSPSPAEQILKPGEGPQVDLQPRFGKKAVILKISSISANIKGIDYELVYDTNGVQRGVLGSLNLTSGQDNIIKEILLASCSKNVCVFDKDVSKLNLTVKFTTSSEPLIFQKDFTL